MGGPSKVSFYNRVRHEGVFPTAVVCWSRHDFFTYSLLQYIQFFRNGEALCRPVLYWFKQNWAYNANISKWRKFEATICEICSSENSRFRRAVRTFCCLWQSFFFLVLYRRFRPHQKQIIRKYKNDPYSRQTTRIRKWPTELRKKLSSSKVRGQQRKYKIDLHENVLLIKQQ